MQTNYLSIIPEILNPEFRRVLELCTKMCQTSRPSICCVHSPGADPGFLKGGGGSRRRYRIFHKHPPPWTLSM